MAVVSEKSWFGPCYSIFHVFKNAKKCVFFWVLTALLVRWDLAFADSFCRVPLCGSATAFACFLNNKFQEFFKNSYYSRPHLLAQKRAILPNFWCFWRMTFREMEQFVLKRSLVLFVVDNFRLHRFLHKKHYEKVEFLCFFFTDVNSSQKEIKVPFWCQKASHFDRCTYRGFLFSHIFHSFWKVGVLRVPYVIVLKMQKILYLCGSWKWCFFFLVSCCAIGIY